MFFILEKVIVFNFCKQMKCTTYENLSSTLHNCIVVQRLFTDLLFILLYLVLLNILIIQKKMFCASECNSFSLPLN